MSIEHLLEGNARFIREEFGAHPEYYAGLVDQQRPTVLWIGCADSRVSVDNITGTRPGSIFVHRNVANVISFNDNNFGAVLEYALEHLGIREVVVCGHYFCGGLQALAEGIENHIIHDWLNVAYGAWGQLKALPGYDEMDPNERMEKLTQLHVRRQIDHLQRFAIVEQLEADPNEHFEIHGLVYDFRTGELSRVPEG